MNLGLFPSLLAMITVFSEIGVSELVAPLISCIPSSPRKRGFSFKPLNLRIVEGGQAEEPLNNAPEVAHHGPQGIVEEVSATLCALAERELRRLRP